jgi:hypothetical protein
MLSVMTSAQFWLTEEGAYIAIGPNETGRIEDPAIDQSFKLGQFARVELFAAPKSMQVTVCVKAEFRWAVVAMGQFLTSITERLKVSDRLWMLQGCHDLCEDGSLCYQRAIELGLA